MVNKGYNCVTFGQFTIKPKIGNVSLNFSLLLKTVPTII